LFAVLTIAGWVIGSFSILVGGFGIANIMFVSVKERTNLIGIQKSLGAKNYSILFQFLFEAVMLSLVGGLVGIFLVYLLSFLKLGSLEILLHRAMCFWDWACRALSVFFQALFPPCSRHEWTR
jgi:putative ABC transport system permease protein